MKVDRVLILLFAIGATSSLMSMEKEKKGHLKFVLDHSTCVTGYAKHNMDCAVKPAKFLGQNILDVLPVDKEDRKVIERGFFDAAEKKEPVKVTYTLKDPNTSEIGSFVATITALKTKDKFYNYFIKVQEAKK